MLKRIFSIFMIVILLTSISCKKEAEPIITKTNNLTIDENHQAIPWVAAAAIYVIVKLSQGHYEHRITYDRQTGRKISDTWGCYGVGICKAVSYGINGNCLTINDSSIPFDSLSNADIKTLNYFELIRIDDNTVALGIDYRKYPDEANVFFYGEEIDLGMDILIDDSEVIEQLGITTSSINLSKGIHQVYENGDYKYVIFN